MHNIKYLFLLSLSIMDKVQKQLIDTYFRKRKIATEQGDEYKLKRYEINGLINNPEFLNQFKTDGKIGKEFSSLLFKYGNDKNKVAELISDNIHSLNVSDAIDVDDPENTKVNLDYIFKNNEYYRRTLGLYEMADIISVLPNYFSDGEIHNAIIKDMNYYFNSGSLATIISKLPKYINDVPYDKFSYYEIAKILVNQPQLYSYFEEKFDSDKQDERNARNFYFGLGHNNDNNISSLLAKYPKIYKFIKSKLSKNLNRMVISINPDIEFESNDFDYWDTTELLKKQPNLISRLDISKIESWHAREILKVQPQLFKYFKNIFKKYDLVNLINDNPDIIKYMGFDDINTLDTYDRIDILANNPKLFDKIKTDDFDEHKINRLLIKQPLLATKYDLSSLKAHNIKTMIREQPKLAKYLNLNVLDSYDISDLIIDNPKLVTVFNLDKLDNYNIRDILISKPNLIKYFQNYLDKLYSWHIDDILEKQPKLEPYLKNLSNRW